MKIKNLFLALFLLVAFGTTEFFSQTTATAKPQRTYSKKPDATKTSATATAKPQRTYTKKPDERTSATSTDAKPKRTYTKETTAPAKTATASSKAGNSAKAKATKQQSTQKPTGYQQTTTGKNYNGHQVMVGPRGGRYYINKNGNKTYIK